MSFSDYEERILGKKPFLSRGAFLDLRQRVQCQKDDDLMLFGEFKMQLVWDPTVPPGTIEMHTGENFVRVFRVSWVDPDLTGAVDPRETAG